MTFKPDPKGFEDLEREIAEGLLRVAQEIVREAEPNVPRESGRTAASGFAVGYHDGNEIGSTGSHGPAPDTAGAVAYAGFRGPLAHLFETGTVERVQGTTGRRTGRITPRPFLGPAGAAVAARAKSIMKGGG